MKKPLTFCQKLIAALRIHEARAAKKKLLTGVILGWLCAGMVSHAQTADVTIALNDAGTTVAAPLKAGLNQGTPLRVDSANFYANIFQATNWNFQPKQSRIVFVQNTNAAANQIVPQPYYTYANGVYPANFFAGAQVDITAVATPWTGAELGCSAQVASSVPYPGSASNTTVTAFAISSNVVTFTSTNTYAAGEVVMLNGLTTGTYLNNVLLTVTSASSSQFAASFTHANVTSTTDAGNAVAQPLMTLNANCGAPTRPGDVMTLLIAPTATPEAVWEAGQSRSGGATMTSDFSTPMDGSQSLIIDTTPSGSGASYKSYSDDDTHDVWHLVNGTWTISVMAQARSGSAPVTIQVDRVGTVLCSKTFTPTSTPTVYSQTCTPGETTPSPGLLTMTIIQTAGQVRAAYNRVSFAKTSGRDGTNVTGISDEALFGEAYTDGGVSSTVYGTTRAWNTQHAHTFANWTVPANQAAQTSVGDPESPDGSGSETVTTPQLQDIVARAIKLHNKLYLVVPSTFLDSEVSQLITFLMTQQPGQSRSACSVGCFLEFFNEAWNQNTPFQSLPYRPGDRSQYEDYINRIALMAKAARANSLFNPALIKLGANMQAVNGYGINQANGAGSDWAHLVSIGGYIDFMDIEGYTLASESDVDTEQDQWQAPLREPYDNIVNTGSTRQQQIALVRAMNTCGPSGTSQCQVAIYEEANGTQSTCGGYYVPTCGGVHNQPLTQAALAQVNVGAGQALVNSKQAFLQMQAGYLATNYFTEGGWGGATSIGFFHGWHNMVDMGGATTALNSGVSDWQGKITPAPSAIGLNLYNSTVIGKLFPCPVTGPTYNAAASNNGPLTALSNVPYITVACFADASGNRAYTIWNDDYSPHYAAFSGTNPPSGTVTVKSFAPYSLNQMNEVSTSGATNTYAAQATPTSSTLSSPGLLTLPAHSMQAIFYMAGGGTTVPPVNKQSTGAVVTSGAVSELLHRDAVLLGGDPEAVLLYAGSGGDSSLLLERFDQF